MDITALTQWIGELEESGISFYLEEGQLKCKAPKGMMTPSLAAQIRLEKEKIIALMQGEQGCEPAETANSLSYSQQRIWISQQMDPSSADFNVPLVFMASGRLNCRALSLALNKMIQRHDILRTVYQVQQSQVSPVLCDDVVIELAYHDLSHLAEADCRIRQAEFKKQYLCRAFDLEQEIPLRACVVKQDESHHMILIVLHHIAADGWSVNFFSDELTRLYQLFDLGKQAELPPVTHQYRDYVAWENHQLSGKNRQQLCRYWQQRLEGAPPVHSLPVARQRSAAKEKNRHRAQRLSKALMAQLNRLAKHHHASLFMVMQTAFAFMICQWSSQRDVVIGTPVAGRNQSNFHQVMGCFINSLAIRTRLDPGQSFAQLLAENRNNILADFQHQGLPFELLKQELADKNSDFYSPVFQVWFVMQNFAKADIDLADVSLQRLENDIQYSRFELNLYISEFSDGAVLNWLYLERLFSEETIVYVMGQYQQLLEQIAETPEAPLNRLQLFDAADIYRRGNDPVKLEGALTDYFKARVNRHGEQCALDDGVVTMTYRQLDRLSDMLGHNMLKAFDPGAHVGLLCRHNALMVATVLGCLKAGIVYVPLDPLNPVGRLQQIARDAQLRGILADELLAGEADALVREMPGLQRLLVNGREAESRQEIAFSPVAQDAPAYILYTSGSTGAPKGVCQSRGNLAFYGLQYGRQLDIGPQDRVLQLSAYHFDASVMDIFGALLCGAQLVMTDMKTASPEQLNHGILRKKITVYHSTPTVFRYIFTAGQQEFTRLRAVVLGGEKSQSHDLRLFKLRCPSNSLFINGYGPTESTLACQWRVPHQELDTELMPLVGHAVPGIDHKVETAPGVGARVFEVGELVLSSPYLALGYWQNPGQSEKVFSSATDDAGQTVRQYRTGDQVLLLPDGQLRFVGRSDSQVKLRGIRIELSEIEALLHSHPAVTDAAVNLSAGEGEEVLAAYYVPAPASGPLADDEVRRYLKKHLPAYMIPGCFIPMEELPKTGSGKIDRKALPPAGQQPEKQYRAPENEAQRLMCGLWASALGRPAEQISICANFFELGGHSLQVLRLLSAIENTFAVTVSLQEFFNCEQLRHLVAAIEQRKLVISIENKLAEENAVNEEGWL
ncbi:non-ribosomal peptide synthetase [Thalassomonas viridans]|uniref:Non-ribosomal peptide synthetase n=1 Tax=Thalassomonas viridans TaxID=137584 RepID=A0AAE9ZC24_9GAMM|nr:non-ribosomal peptide synthetase [Thalassomonas viridans]WDE09275.1 non-ribosomal peptide synthetase [Thalassomonas viridans]